MPVLQRIVRGFQQKRARMLDLLQIFNAHEVQKHLLRHVLDIDGLEPGRPSGNGQNRAKPGHGGVLPGPKVTTEIAEARGVPVGVDCVSPAAHSAFATPLEMMQFIAPF